MEWRHVRTATANDNLSRSELGRGHHFPPFPVDLATCGLPLPRFSPRLLPLSFFSSLSLSLLIAVVSRFPVVSRVSHSPSSPSSLFSASPKPSHASRLARLLRFSAVALALALACSRSHTHTPHHHHPTPIGLDGGPLGCRRQGAGQR